MLRPAIGLLALIALGSPAYLSARPAVAVQGQQSREQQEKGDKGKGGKNLPTPTAEQIAELVIAFYGQRPVLQQVRRSGIERGVMTRSTQEGRTEDVTYERRFMRGENSAKDKIRLDQKSPSTEYSLLFDAGRVSGIIGGVNFTPRQETQDEFLSRKRHDIDSLLRYVENKSTVTLVGREKQKNIDMYVLDLVDADKNRTRYYVSAQRARVLWLEYEEATAPGATPVKYKRTFHDYNYVQGTLVPYRTLTFADGKLLDQMQVRSVTYGVKLEESLFKIADAG